MIGLEHIVKEFRQEYKEVAKSIGVSSQTIQDWLKKRRKIPKKRLQQLSNLFDLPEKYFQKELNFMEREEIALHYLENFSEEVEIPLLNDKGEVVDYYKKNTHENEIQYLRENIENRKRKNDIFMNLETLLGIENLNSNEQNSSPLLSNTSKAETLNKVIKVMQDQELYSYFEVVIQLLNYQSEFGGRVISTVSPQYRDFAEDFLKLLEKHKIKTNKREN
ncbi:helix-turn-helix domain-containing protein [Priestia megaterium]|uniref:helix-turn-helix domain-containing protein n=1 Tax=Priestia megaterium TaxID=1404 RepID=UPI002E22ADAE|nr:helix-turn-helix domain-containing protein [Priestia megaterium]